VLPDVILPDTRDLSLFALPPRLVPAGCQSSWWRRFPPRNSWSRRSCSAPSRRRKAVRLERARSTRAPSARERPAAL